MLARLRDYEAAVREPRENFLSLSGLTAMLADALEPDTLELFLIHFSAFGRLPIGDLVAPATPLNGAG